MTSVTIFSQEPSGSKNENTSADTVFEIADKLPEYPGGINIFRSNFSRKFNLTKIDTKTTVKSEVQFVINEEGYLTDILATGENKSMNKEMERVIKSFSKTKWNPAEINGKPVKYRFRLPISMN